jgi:DNA-binding beta-propeller fold protein YncE
MGSIAGLDVDRDGSSMWVFERCGRNTCKGSDLPTIFKLDASGNVVKNFGGGMFTFPHGVDIDPDGNLWVTDARDGHQVVKFSPEGKILMRLGKAGVAGNGPDTFNQPSDVVIAPNGDIFVADGHDSTTNGQKIDSNARVVRFSKDGKFIKTWGKKGSGPGEFDSPHTIAMDSSGRVFVGDRGNERIQIFDQDGKFIAEWRQFGIPNGLYIDKNDTIYVADSHSNAKRNPGFKRGVRIGSAKDGRVTGFIALNDPDPENHGNAGLEGVAVDGRGNLYTGHELAADREDRTALKKHVRK